MTKFFVTFFSLCLSLATFATPQKALGDSAYMRGDYIEAIALYDKALQQGHNAAVYQNQGNAYYRLEQYPKAVLAYERGLRYAPSNGDLAHSLVLANSKLPERLRSTPDFFISVWYHEALLALSVPLWAVLAVTFLGLTLGLFLVYLLIRPVLWRKVGFFGSILSLLLCLWASWATFALRTYLTTHPTAIVMQRTQAADSPSTHSTATTFVPVGTKVEITDRSLPKFWRVALPDGKQVWVDVKHIEAI